MNPTLVNWMLVLHVLAAIWLGAGAFGGAVVRAQGRKAKSLPERVMALRIGWRMVNVLGLPGGIVAGLLGIGMLHPLGYGFKPGWVKASLAIWLAMLANSIFYTRPNLKRILAAAEASLAAGAPSEELKALVARRGPAIAGELNQLGFVVLVLLMMLKPF